jgi:hypothetical protein
MPTFYRSSTVRITHRSVRVFLHVPAVYLIDDLGPVWVVTPGPPRVPVRVRCCSGAVVAAGLASTQQPDLAPGWTIAMVVLGVSAILLSFRRRTSPTGDHALVTTCRGEWVRLYSTPDPVEFGQIRRALQRALEWHDEASA